MERGNSKRWEAEERWGIKGTEKNHSEEKRERERKEREDEGIYKFVFFFHHLFANIGTIMGDFWDNRLHSFVYLGV